MVTLVKHDLEFILKQIKIAEAHAAGGDLAELVAGYNGNDGLTQAHLLPYGLRTVDGSYNNLIPGRESWGAADQSFPGIFDPNYMNDADGDSLVFGPGMIYDNNDYGVGGSGGGDGRPASGTGPGQTYAPGSGTVIDADPRLISNLIVDQTLNNPAAISAALMHAGVRGAALTTALTEIVNAHTILKAIPAPGPGQTPPNAYTLAKGVLDGLLQEHGIEMDGNSVLLPNVSPDDGLSSPYNGWMTIFGQFFDHGLDLVAKGGNGTVYVPLQPDDPLYVSGSHTNFMALTRVTVDAGRDGLIGTADDGLGLDGIANTADDGPAHPVNLTTPWVDQNQTYGSTASKQVFMREYVAGPDGKPIATGYLLEGTAGGLATWADIKAQAANVLGIRLTDADVGKIPLIAADEYGNFIPGPNGYPQLVVGLGPDGQLGTADDVLREGNPAEPVSTQGAILTGHAFLDDIAHAAVPILDALGALQADTDSGIGYFNADGTAGGFNTRGGQLAYDNEMLDAHYVAGDGRANENIALTAVHHVFHSEHNRLIDQTKEIALASGDLDFLNDWLLVDVAAMPATPEELAALVWDGERLFQAGRFTNEMEYQHLVFEEFGRMMQPDIDAFVFEPSADINPSIAAEFAHVVYRFGHSMLREDIARISLDENGDPVVDDLALFDGFLNPVAFANAGDADTAAGAIIRGMTRQTGNEIDEFVTDVLRNQLLGVPLDLATINIARGRDVGTPPLNAARQKFYDGTGDTLLKPYQSWADFALNLKNPASIINFIAAYGTHDSITQALTVEAKRSAATLLVLGGAGAPADRLDFLNASGSYAGGVLGGLNNVDFWIGGLAEKKMSFGGMLGSTFSFVFQMTMENLQDADRFYYLSRTQGLNLLNELENNTFAEIVMRNTDLGEPGSTALPGNVFSAFQMPTLEMDISKQLGADPVQDDPTLQAFSRLVERRYANGNLINDTVTDASYIRVNSNEHFTIGGTENDDTIISGGGDDAIWGRGGNDRIEAGYGVDKVFGGDGDDIITNAGTDIGEADFLHGNAGNDVIHGGSGLSLIFGNEGNDFIITGPDGKEAFGGTGNDFILGGTGGDFLLGNEGDDWLEGGQRFDTLAGENSELFFNSSIIGHDVLNGGSGDTDYDGESGDDIMFQSEGIQRSNGMAGFDWAIHKGDVNAANSDLGIPLFATQEAFILRDRFDLVEGLSGWIHDDTLTGRREAVNTRAEATGTAAIPGPDSALDSYSNALLEKNVDLITGLRALVAHIARTSQTGNNGVVEQVVMDTADASDILLGGGGDDIIKGLAGNDVIDGDKWLNVRILVTPLPGQAWTAFSVDSMTELAPRMLSGEIKPGQLSIVREILDGNVAGDIDTAVYTDVRANYTFGLNSDASLYIDHSGFVEPQQDDDAGENEANPNPVSDGRDTVRGIEKLRFTDGVLNVIEGTAASETLNGTGDDDLIVGKGGNDILNGLAGNDILLGGTGNDTLNGGSGDDTYAFGLGDGSDTITETSGTDRISIAAGALTGLAFSELTSPASANDNLLIQFNGQQITVVDHFDQSGEAVEFVNFNGGTYEGYALDGDFAISIDDNGTRTAAAGVNTVLAGTSGGDDLVGNDGNDLLFGNAGDDDLDGGAGDDLLVGGSGNDELIGGLGADTMVGGTNNDVYQVDDAGDVVIEALNEGTDTVETTLAAYTLGANVENLTFTGAGAFAGTGNQLANRIEGGDGIDTLIGLDGNDTYIVTAGDVIVETATGGTDTVQTDQTYQLGAFVENLTLGGNGDINGTGNSETNVINGNGGDNQLFGAGGNDTINGGGGNDFIDGGTGNDTINAGTGDNVIVGGDGNDIINLTTSNGTDDIIRYTASNFGADIINGFDANAAQGQDRIDLSAFGLSASDIGTTSASRIQIEDIEDGAVDDTLITIRDAGSNVIGSIRLEEVDNSTVTAADFIFTTPSTPVTGNDFGTTITGTNGNNTLDGNLGNDIINALGGDDIIIWNANASGATDGRDIVNGGTEGTAGDTFVINGNALAETYRIYTLAAWDAVPGNNLSSFNGRTPEIVITRNGTGFANVIAELTDIEEIRINGVDPAASGTAGGDTIEIIGDFSATSLRPNTITIEGTIGDDMVDITSLGSAHRIVFRSNGGNDTIVGSLRPQDVIALPAGTSIADYEVSISETGQTTLVGDDYSITFTALEGMPQFADEDYDPDGDDDDYPHLPGDDDDDDDSDGDDDDDDVDAPGESTGQHTGVGTSGDDVLVGTANEDTILGLAGNDSALGGSGRDIIRGADGDDYLSGEGGRDMLFGGAGNDDLFGGGDDDMLYGDAGADRIFGGDGRDIIDGGAGDDIAHGGAGNDHFVASANDGNDVYYGDESSACSVGSDTLDMAAITANINVDLGSGFMGRGSATSSLTGSDTLWSIENVITGSGNDTIVASAAVNVMDGGAGNDTFRFLSADDADGDTIHSFQPGDKIDLSGIDAKGSIAGNQAFTLVTGSGFNAEGALKVTHEVRGDGDYTVVHGNQDGGSGAEFKISIKGTHTLTASDFEL